MNMNNRILQTNHNINVVHEGPKTMSQHLNGSSDVQNHQPSINVCSNNVFNQSIFYTQLEDHTSLHNGMLLVLHLISEFFIEV